MEDLLKKLSGKKVLLPPAQPGDSTPAKSVSGQDLIDRVKELFTPEEAEALARRIEEGRERAYD